MSGPFGSTPHNLFNTTSTSFYNGVINQSLRFHGGGDATYLSKTWDTDADSNQIFTFSCWFKRGELGNSGIENFVSSINTGTGTGQGSTHFGLYNNDKLAYYSENGGENAYTKRVLRDSSSWYHVVYQYDTTQSTDTDRIKVYLNGELITQGSANWTSAGFGFPETPGANSVMSSMNQNSRLNAIGAGINTSINRYYFSGYMAEVIMLDGVTADYTAFAEFKNGILIPKAYTGSYGTNGYRLTFEGTGTGTTSNGTTAQNNIGDDQSGNGNNWAVNLLAAGDVVSDTPESNFPVMNNLVDAGSAQSVFAFTEGNLKVRNTASNYSQAITTRSVRTGKWYYECYINEAGYPSWMIGWMVGRQNGLGENEFPTFAGAQNAEQASFTGFGYFTGSNLYISDWGDTSSGIATQQFAYSGAHSAGDAPTTGDIIGVAADFDNRKFYWHINGEYINSGSGTSNPSTGANANSTYTASEAPDDAEKYPWLTGYGTSSFIFNFGQDGTFANTKTAQGNSDENGVGDFFYSVPTGFLAFAPQNFSDTTLSPNATEQATDNFNTLLWTGDGNTNRAITGVGFTPDWFWLKSRSHSEDHAVEDTVRGAGNKIEPNNDGNTDTTATAVLSSHDADGFTGPSSTPGNLNVTDRTYVGWFWKAGGAPTATNSAGAGNVPTTGSVMIDGVASTSSLAGSLPATKISANTKAGFSIVQFTGNNSNSTIAHGLTSAPDVCIIKKTSGTGNWFVYTRAENDQASDEAHVGYFNLSTAAFTASASIFNDTPPTDTVFSVGTGNSNNNSATYIAYLFHEVEGFSKFGYFAGNSSSAGTFVYCGFKPARIWLRQDATGIDWTSYDLLREGFNEENDSLRFAAATEQSDEDLDILSNGFKMRRNMANNQGDVMFFAWADSPVKYSNSR